MAAADAALLCLCARRRAQEPGFQLEAAHTQDLDWDALLDLAHSQGVIDLLPTPLSGSASTMPAHVRERLEERALEATGENLKRVTQLVDVLALLDRHSIRALTFKGPALAQGIYGHLGRRVSNDLDLLIHRRDAAKVRPILLAHGYHLPTAATGSGGSLLHGLIPATGRDDTLLPEQPWHASLDVHVAFAYWTLGIRLDVDALFDRAVTVDLAGHEIATLCADDLILVLAIHGMMHGWYALRPVSDIDAVADHVADWPALVRRAKKAGMSRVLRVALLLAEELCGTVLPPAVAADAHGDAAAEAIARTVTSRLFDPLARDKPFNHHRWLPMFLEGPHRKLGYHLRAAIEMWFLNWPWDEWLGRREARRE
jgi:hypothetical protein